MLMVDPNSMEPAKRHFPWCRVTKKNMVFGRRQADMDWFELEKQTKLYSIFGEDAVLGARFIPKSFPGNLLQDPGAEQWTWCDGFVGPCHISGIYF